MSFRKIVFLLIAAVFVISFAKAEEYNSIEAEEIILSNLLKTKYEKIINFPSKKKLDWISKNKHYFYKWEYTPTDIIKKNYNLEGNLSFVNQLYLYDSDVFYGRKGLPEARRSPLYVGNNYNLTFNNNLLKSDDFIQREGTIKNELKVYFKKEINNFTITGDFSFKTGENLSADNSFFKFNNIKLKKKNAFFLEAGKITPYFDELTLDKKNSPLTGVEVTKKWSNTTLRFVAARPDIPLEFGYKDKDSVVLIPEKWNKDNPYIFHFDEPYNYFSINRDNLPVYINAHKNGNIIDITKLCIINHAEVIIPSEVMNEDYDRIEIVYNKTITDQQLSYLNAFKFSQKIYKNSRISISYVDLHNDTHSVENVSANFSPFDSNIWDFSFKTSFNNFKFETRLLQSKIIPDDYKYNKREIDYVYYIKSKYNNKKLKTNFKYAWMGADYILNVIPLSHKWKLVEDCNADFKWDYEDKYGDLGKEIYSFNLKYGNNIIHKLNFKYSFNLKSDYKTTKYAEYDRFYLPYYSQSGNDYRLYGEGVDDGKKIYNISYLVNINNLTYSLSLRKVYDDNLYFSDLKRDYKIYTTGLKYKISNLTAQTDFESKENFLYYSPYKNDFIKQEKDKTWEISLSYNNKFELLTKLFFKINEKIKYIYDADSIYNNKNWYFKEFILKDMNIIDENIIKNDLYFELLYKFTDKSYLSLYYDVELYKGDSNNYFSGIGYNRNRRGIKYYSNLGIKDLFFVAFYDEDELFFETIDQFNYTRKEIGALLQVQF